ncbi:fimbrial protein [Providencia vermicola]|uniref:Fimbrial protein n=3 Tax=Providencia TaxID=586 RepID=A0ABD5L5Z9_PROST|nr:MULTISPECIES: fimbrial protein [Providencia]ELR5045929.1 fimbrial protein [Providencia rettgeri]ELR5293255.1 fimbrial protein [Providencia stuartii]ELX8379866.1 fimbrial protein [Providencia stuartii]EMD5259256.1 fimbrial protein [Providencia stuartii]MBG5920651.1 fimbrial protein [Providencia stuartii]
MFITDKFTKSLISVGSTLLFAMLTFGYTIQSVQAVEMKVIGKVIKGTCVVDVDSMEVKFNQPIFIPEVKEDINDKTFLKPFSLKYNCSGFDLSTGTAPYLMKITASTGTSIDTSNKIYPTTNNTKAAFVLKKCDDSKANCNIVDINGGGVVPFQVTENASLESHFEVSVVQLGASKPTPGELVAAVDITLLQP